MWGAPCSPRGLTLIEVRCWCCLQDFLVQLVTRTENMRSEQRSLRANSLEEAFTPGACCVAGVASALPALRVLEDASLGVD